MDTLEIIERLEKLVKSENFDTSKNNINPEFEAQKSPFKEFMDLIIAFVFNLLKTPFKLVAKYVTTEIIKAVKRDSKLYAFIMGLMGVMFVFFSVLWLFISIAVGVYFYDKGNSLFVSIVYSIIFQFISFSFVAIIALILSKSIKSLKMFKDISGLSM